MEAGAERHQTHETQQEVLLRGIQAYREHLTKIHTELAFLRKEFETTRGDVATLRAQCEVNPSDTVAQERYKNAVVRLAQLHESLFEDPKNIKVIQEIPEIEKELALANAEFLRSLH